MATERLAPDAILSSTNLSGTVTNIDDDPDSPDANWLTLSGSDGVDTQVRVSFPTPSGFLNTGAGLQEFRVQVREQPSASGTAATVDIELWENGALVSTLLSGAAIVDTGSEVKSVTWNASLLSDISGADVECRVYCHGDNDIFKVSGEIGAIEWNADYLPETIISVDTSSLTSTGYAPTVQSIVDIPSSSLSLTQNETSLLSDVSVGTAALSLNDYTVDVRNIKRIAVDTSTLSLTGNDPTLLRTVSIDTTALNLAQHTTSIHSTVSVPSGALSLTENAVTIDLSVYTILVDSRTLALTNSAVDVVNTIHSDSGSVSLNINFPYVVVTKHTKDWTVDVDSPDTWTTQTPDSDTWSETTPDEDSWTEITPDNDSWS